ncbi:allophanate hydrolase subunit 1 [Xinfangfangia sp. D13-10-4-6]|uniref:5-oxoprolinase subunit B family protein n=1 Tax=Pseudogemmobacter hezensis TaxID=2737662 RepID=UPI001556432D|nr:allophanate hydrolase subunit 1 [Pseudogemmobacter hezensis]NPD17508.1 allophanate hydrolase subunit 1 [Pseudogemmobacter hezensis]
MQSPRFRPVAEHSLLVEFGEGVDATLHQAVLQLDAALNAAPPPEMVETVPGNACLLVRFDMLRTDHAAMEAAIRQRLDARPAEPAEPRQHQIDICYDEGCAVDLAAIAAATGQSEDTVIAAHLGATYQVFMYGFAPGYAYLTGVPPALQLPRKPAAIRDIPAGSVLIASSQCIISTLKMPSGWWIIGKSPTRILTSDPTHPFLFAPGDEVRFRRIPASQAERTDG